MSKVQVTFKQDEGHSFDVVVEGKKVDSIHMNYPQRYTQAHTVVAKIAVALGIKVSDIKIHYADVDDYIFIYPVVDIQSMAEHAMGWEDVQESSRFNHLKS